MKRAADNKYPVRLVPFGKHLANAAAHVRFANQMFIVRLQRSQFPQATAEFQDRSAIRLRVGSGFKLFLPPRFMIGIAAEPS